MSVSCSQAASRAALKGLSPPRVQRAAASSPAPPKPWPRRGLVLGRAHCVCTPCTCTKMNFTTSTRSNLLVEELPGSQHTAMCIRLCLQRWNWPSTHRQSPVWRSGAAAAAAGWLQLRRRQPRRRAASRRRWRPRQRSSRRRSPRTALSWQAASACGMISLSVMRSAHVIGQYLSHQAVATAL